MPRIIAALLLSWTAACAMNLTEGRPAQNELIKGAAAVFLTGPGYGSHVDGLLGTF